jgi:hypothetical protein
LIACGGGLPLKLGAATPTVMMVVLEPGPLQ